MLVTIGVIVVPNPMHGIRVRRRPSGFDINRRHDTGFPEFSLDATRYPLGSTQSLIERLEMTIGHRGGIRIEGDFDRFAGMIPTLEHHLGGEGVVQFERFLFLVERQKPNGRRGGIDDEFQMRRVRGVQDGATIGTDAFGLVDILERQGAATG